MNSFFGRLSLYALVVSQLVTPALSAADDANHAKKVSAIVDAYLGDSREVAEADKRKSSAAWKSTGQSVTGIGLIAAGSYLVYRFSRVEMTKKMTPGLAVLTAVPLVATFGGGLTLLHLAGVTTERAEEDVLKAVEKTPFFNSLLLHFKDKHLTRRFLRDIYSGRSVDKLTDTYITNAEEASRIHDLLLLERADFESEILPRLGDWEGAETLREIYTRERVFLRYFAGTVGREASHEIDQALDNRRLSLIMKLKEAGNR